MSEPGSAPLLQQLAVAVELPDTAAEQATRELLARLTPPGAGLGQLQDFAVWLAGRQGRTPAREPSRIRAILFAGEHAIADLDVSAATPAQAAAHLRAALLGDGIADVLGEVAAVGIQIVDVGLSEPATPDPVRRVGPSARTDESDAISLDAAIRAVQIGADVADEQIDAGTDLLIAGDVGRGSTFAAATLVACLTRTEPVKLVRNDATLRDDVWARRVAALRDARLRAMPHRYDPQALLAVSAGADIAALVGFLLRAAARRTPVLLDGLVSASAALLAQDVSPRAARWWQATHVSAEPAHEVALRQLGQQPLLRLGIEVGEGTGALLAMPVLRGAIRVVARLAAQGDADAPASAHVGGDEGRLDQSGA